MDLVLWRHCEAAPGLPDEARPLTPRGARQAIEMARWLARELPAGRRIVVSPAARAQQTARALDREFETLADVGPGAGVDALLDAVGWPDAPRVVVVVGHQPTLGRVVSKLVDGDEADRSLSPGSVCWLASRAHGEAILRIDLAPTSA